MSASHVCRHGRTDPPPMYVTDPPASSDMGAGAEPFRSGGVSPDDATGYSSIECGYMYDTDSH